MKYLTFKVEEAVAITTINRPPANALAKDLIQEIDDFLSEIESDDNIHVILLHGEGKFFSAGADIKEFTSIKSGEEFSKLAAKGQEVFERLENFKKPIIAAIHGAALGGGLELAMACHMRIVTENAKLGMPELELGLIPGFAGTQRLPKYVGVPKATEMILTSEPISGKEAVQYGLANKAFTEEELLAKTLELAKKIARKSPVSVGATLEMLQYTKHSSYYEGVKAESNAFGEVFVSEDAKEGIQAFIEKRAPKFNGN